MRFETRARPISETVPQEVLGQRNLCSQKAAVAANGVDEAVEMYLSYTDDWMTLSRVRQIVVKETSSSNNPNNEDGCLLQEHSHRFRAEYPHSYLEGGSARSLARGLAVSVAKTRAHLHPL